MSQRQAIAAVTAVLSELVSDAINGVLPATQTTNQRPGDAVADTNPVPRVNIYLYRAEPNASLRNAVDPVRSSDGRLIRRPVAAWNLHYLLTCVGDEEELEPDLLLGAVVTGLDSNGLLSRGLVASVDASLAAESGNKRFAAGSQLEQQVDIVRLTPIDLSLDTLTQLWSSFGKESYALSIAYQAAAVLMSPDVQPQPPLPVASAPSLAVSTLQTPHISKVVSSEGSAHPILSGSTLVIEGERLRAPFTQIRIGTLDIDIPESALRAGRIELALSPPDAGGTPRPRDLAPGVLGVQVRHLTDISPDPAAPALRPSGHSNVVPIVLRPTITRPPALIVDAEGDAAIAVTTAPAVRADFRCCLLLNEFQTGEPRSLVLERWSLDEASGVQRILFKARDVPSGNWLLRIQINDADSPLLRDARGAFSAPLLGVP